MMLTRGSKLGPYEILSSIGSGGMGEVWKARDTRLGRIVAIKKVKEQHSERFKQEARSIAALNHPNICQIHDIGDDYLVLEYVEGKPLSSPLPEQEAVKLAIQIATALEAAHKKGIIHRDLKPSNIMVSDEGIVKLLDFGLAKLYEQDQSTSSLPTEDFPATQAGAILGTVAYMSPEQAQGQPADARSDIFSFGLMLYEMLSGRRAFSGDSNYAVMDAIVKKEPSPIQTSSALEKIVKRCLEKNPEERYQRMSELKVELVKATAKKATVTAEEPQPSIAVLPFVNMSGDKEQEYFSDGLAEEIINALTKIPGLKVIARTSAFAFKGKDQDITRIAEALRVSNILEGSVRKSGDRIRVTAQLIDASDGSHLWSERYDRNMTDVFAIQDEISQAIAEKLRIELIPGCSINEHQTNNVNAYNLYLRGRYHHYNLTPEGMTKAIKYFKQAIAADRNYILAWVDLAHTYILQGHTGVEKPEFVNKLCRQALTQALDLDDMLAEAHSVLGNLLACEFKWRESKSEFERALEINPTAPDSLLDYSYYYLSPMRRFNEVVSNLQIAADLDPMSVVVQLQLGRHYYFLEQYDRSIKQLFSVLEIDPNPWIIHLWLALNYIETGEQDKAIQSAETAARIPNTPFAISFLGYIYAVCGRIDESQKVFDELQKLAQKTYIPSFLFATIHIGLGEIEKSIECIEKSLEEGHSWTVHFTLPPFSGHIRSHPRYRGLLRRMNLES